MGCVFRSMHRRWSCVRACVRACVPDGAEDRPILARCHPRLQPPPALIPYQHRHVRARCNGRGPKRVRFLLVVEGHSFAGDWHILVREFCRIHVVVLVQHEVVVPSAPTSTQIEGCARVRTTNEPDRGTKARNQGIKESALRIGFGQALSLSLHVRARACARTLC